MNRPTRTEPDKTEHTRALCDQALWPEVLAFAQKWHTENPADAKALFYSGVALSALGQLAEAETSYRRALKLDAADFKTWNKLAARLFEALKRPGEAVCESLAALPPEKFQRTR